MSKRAGLFYGDECLNECLKKRKLNEDVDLLSIPEFNLGDDWYVHRAYLNNYFNSKCIDNDFRKTSILISSLKNEAYQNWK